jgi:hypothetical protein
MRKTGIVLVALVSLSAVQSHAETYRCQKNGRAVFSDRLGENCEVIQVKPVLPSEDDMARVQVDRTRKALEKQKQQEAAAEKAKTDAVQRQEQIRRQRQLEAMREAAKPIWYGTQLDVDHPTAPSGYRLPSQPVDIEDR